MRRPARGAVLVLAAAAAATAPVRAGEGGTVPGRPPELRELVAVVHLHTALVDGAASPEELARAARA
ncbi:MAG: hypothetical protein ACRD5D_08890, partial [Candidatus Polarisedimenticolia bacterium]